MYPFLYEMYSIPTKYHPNWKTLKFGCFQLECVLIWMFPSKKHPNLDDFNWKLFQFWFERFQIGSVLISIFVLSDKPGQPFKFQSPKAGNIFNQLQKWGKPCGLTQSGFRAFFAKIDSKINDATAYLKSLMQLRFSWEAFAEKMRFRHGHGSTWRRPPAAVLIAPCATWSFSDHQQNLWIYGQPDPGG